MKILVFSDKLDVGGALVNAIESAGALRDLYGHDVTYFATPGPLLDLVEKCRLRFIPAPESLVLPSPARMRALRELLLRESFDVIYVWDWYQCLDAYYVAHLWMRVPMAVTEMSMSVPQFLPKSLPTTFGTPDLVDQARAAGRQLISLLLPPVDLVANSPGAVAADPVRERYGLKSSEVTLAIVSRLASWMKSESVRRAIEAVGTLGGQYPLRLVVAGDGDARGQLEQLASEVNSALQRPAVVFTGSQLDPRPVYAAADIVLGMGGSALRGMAFGKPVIVIGEEGFSAPVTPETAKFFQYYGVYGTGGGDRDNSRLTGHIRALVDSPEARRSLGEFGRQFVVEHFDLKKVTAQMDLLLRGAAAQAPRFRTAAVDGLRTAAIWVKQRRFLPARWGLCRALFPKPVQYTMPCDALDKP